MAIVVFLLVGVLAILLILQEQKRCGAHCSTCGKRCKKFRRHGGSHQCGH